MELSYLDVAIKLTMGFLSLVLVINISGKGNLAPSSAMEPSFKLCSRGNCWKGNM